MLQTNLLLQNFRNLKCEKNMHRLNRFYTNNTIKLFFSIIKLFWYYFIKLNIGFSIGPSCWANCSAISASCQAFNLFML